MTNDKYKGKGGSYVRLPDGSRISEADAAKRNQTKAQKSVEKKDDEK